MKNTKNTNEKQNAFNTLLREFESATLERKNNESKFSESLESLATASTLSVLKKLIDVQGVNGNGFSAIYRIRQQLLSNLCNYSNIKYLADTCSYIQVNSNGDIKTVSDTELTNALLKALQNINGDGMDLISTATVAILDEIKKARERNGLTIGFMENTYTIRELKKKVYIKDIESLGGYESKEITPIQQVFKAVRREIMDNKLDNTNAYVYIDEYINDTESDTTTRIYKRLPKYSQLSYEITNSNGEIITTVCDTESVERVEKTVEGMKLTLKQAKVLQLRLSGYGYKAIATYLGITPSAVQNTVKAIQKKAVANNLKPTKQTASQINTKQTASQINTKQTASLKEVYSTDIINAIQEFYGYDKNINW